MIFRKFFSYGLRAHALLISFGLIALTCLLGVRAYMVARAHLLESRTLLEREAPVQDLLYQIESSQSTLEQAQKKWKITHDPVYSQLIFKYRSVIERRVRDLGEIWPELKSGEGVQGLRRKISAERELRVRHARDTAEGLLRLILIALALSLLLTAWLILLLYKGLTEPLEVLSQATNRIRSGDLACRIDSKGVVELRDLASSFNSMAERLEALDQTKRDFLAMISHEIKNPIAALKEGLALLSAPGKDLPPDSQKRCISACQIASKRLEFMINNLLSLSKSESGMFKFDLSEQDFELAVQSSVAEVRPIAEKRNIRIDLVCADSVRIPFNWAAMVQALVNLLLNAIKYGADHSTIEIRVDRTGSDGQFVQVSVTNFGKEISPSEITKVFDPFYRGNNSSKQQGMGIGLHVVKRVVEAHRGFVSAISEAGRTQMIVRIPGESI